MTKVFDAIETTYKAAADPEIWPEALTAIAACLDDVGSILVYGRNDGRFGAICSTSLGAMAEEYHDRWTGSDLRGQRAYERGYFISRDVITDRDVVSEAEMETHPFYADFLSRHGLRYFAAASVSPSPRLSVALSIQRRADKSPYTAEELELTGRLARHVEQAMRLGMDLLDSDALKTTLALALERAAFGVIALDAGARAVYANPFAASALSDVLDLSGLRVRALNAADDRKLSEALRRSLVAGASLSDPLEAPLILKRADGRRPVILRLLPTQAAEHAGLSGAARLLVIANDFENDAEVDLTIIRDALSLTLSEARVAAAVGSGKSPRTAAAGLGLAEETVRSVLKTIYSKVGISRQSELALLIRRAGGA